MSATPSAGALRAAEALEPYLISTQPPFFESEYRDIADIIDRETQAETAALVALLQSMEWAASAVGGFGYTAQACPCCRNAINRGHVGGCKLQQALAKHGEGAL